MSSQKPVTRSCEVLVVGAGPTGLMAANLLKRRGIDVRLIEQRAEPSRESRAFAVMARSMELFDQLGLAETVLDHGVVVSGIDVFVDGERVGGLDYDRAHSPDTPYSFITLHPQAQTEAMLIADLDRLGIPVEREITATGLIQDDDGMVTTYLRLADGTEQTVRSQYVIGADGAHSAVRHALGLSFDGAPYAQTFLLADCRVDWPDSSALDHARFRVFMRGDAIGLFLPLDGHRLSRVMATDLSGKAEGGADTTALDLAELTSAYRDATGLNVRLSDPVWTTRYRVHHRGASRYGQGRVFIAGDAAHIHSPAGGQGMNTGLQDAANLAWKLASVLRADAPPTLLDTYEAERLPVGRDVIATSDKMFSAAVGKTGWETTLRDWLARPVAAMASRIDAVQRGAFRKLAQLEIAYPWGPFVEDGAPDLGTTAPQVGHRAPNASIARHRDVFDLLRGYDFTVLAFSRKPLEQRERMDCLARLDCLAPGVNAHLIARTTIGRDDRTVVATNPEVFESYGIPGRDGQAIYVIRPDGYIAWRGRGLAVDAARAFLDRFGKGSTDE